MLKLYASEIYGIDKSMPMPRQWDWLRTANMQFTFHVLLMIATLLPVALYLLRVYYGIRF